MTIKIDSNVSIPSGCEPRTRGRPIKYPFKDMKDGDSFLLPKGTNIKNVKIYCCLKSKAMGCKFEVVDMGKFTYRVFRTS